MRVWDPISPNMLAQLGAATLAMALVVVPPETPQPEHLSYRIPRSGELAILSGSSPTAAINSTPPSEIYNHNVASRLRNISGLSPGVLSAAIGVSRQTYYAWLQEGVGAAHEGQLLRLERTLEVLVNLIGSGETLSAWLKADTGYGLPIDHLKRGRSDVVLGLTSLNKAQALETSRGSVVIMMRKRSSKHEPIDGAYGYRSITATEERSLTSDLTEDGELLGYIRTD